MQENANRSLEQRAQEQTRTNMVHRSLTKIQRQFNGGIIFLSTKSSGTVGCLSANTLDIDESKREREEERETHDVSQK